QQRQPTLAHQSTGELAVKELEHFLAHSARQQNVGSRAVVVIGNPVEQRPDSFAPVERAVRYDERNVARQPQCVTRLVLGGSLRRRARIRQEAYLLAEV